MVVPLLAVIGLVAVIEKPNPDVLDDPKRDCPTSSVRGTGGAPADLIPAPEGRALWYLQPREDLIGRFDLRSGQTEEFELPSGTEAHGLRAGSDGNLWIAALSGKIGIFDPDTKRTRFVTEGIGRDSEPSHLVEARDGRFYFSEFKAGKLASIDVEDPTRVTEHSEGLPRDNGIHYPILGPNGHIWVTLQLADRLARFNIDTKRFDKLVKFPKDSAPHDVRVTEDGVFYVTLQGGSAIAEYEPDKDRVRIYETTLPEPRSDDPLSPEPKLTDVEIAPGGRSLWVTSFSNRMYRFNIATKKITDCKLVFDGDPPAGRSPTTSLVLTIGPDDEVWATDLLGRRIMRLDRGRGA